MTSKLCVNPVCSYFGNSNQQGYCSSCAKERGIPAAGSLGITYAIPERGVCRAGCGFHGSEDKFGLCSRCFLPIASDLFLQAVAGTVVNDAQPIMKYIASGGSHRRQVTAAEVATLQRCGFFVQEDKTLAEIAWNKQCTESLTYLLSLDASPDTTAAVTLATYAGIPETEDDRVNIGVPVSTLVIDARLELLATQTATPEGLCWFWTGNGPVPEEVTVANAPIASFDGTSAAERHHGLVFALPRALGNSRNRDAVINSFYEQESMRADILRALSHMLRSNNLTLPLDSRGYPPFVPVHTIADLNCLLHGCCMAMLGIRDGTLASDDPHASVVETRTVLRDALYRSITGCPRLSRLISEADDARLGVIVSEVSQGRASLDGAHVFALANVLRRPIIVYAHKGLEGEFRHSLRVPFRVSGVYLPLMWNPELCVCDPILLVYSQGHFTAILTYGEVAEPSRQPVPLCDEGYSPLPVVFGSKFEFANIQDPQSPTGPPMCHSGPEILLMSRYLCNVRTVEATAARGGDPAAACYVTMCDLTHGPLGDTCAANYTRRVWDSLLVSAGAAR